MDTARASEPGPTGPLGSQPQEVSLGVRGRNPPTQVHGVPRPPFRDDSVLLPQRLGVRTHPLGFGGETRLLSVLWRAFHAAVAPEARRDEKMAKGEVGTAGPRTAARSDTRDGPGPRQGQRR